MNFTARKANLKWASGGFGRIGAAMVTVAAGTLLIGMPAGPALAAKASRATPWDGLFSHL
jgi:hypothetical protein